MRHPCSRQLAVMPKRLYGPVLSQCHVKKIPDRDVPLRPSAAFPLDLPCPLGDTEYAKPTETGHLVGNLTTRSEFSLVVPVSWLVDRYNPDPPRNNLATCDICQVFSQRQIQQISDAMAATSSRSLGPQFAVLNGIMPLT